MVLESPYSKGSLWNILVNVLQFMYGEFINKTEVVQVKH